MQKLILTVLMMISINGYSQTGTKNFIDQNYIEVTGKAEMEIVPDQIFLKIVIDEKDSKGKQNLEELERSMIDKLEKIGIDVSKDLAVKDMVSNFKNYWIKSSMIYSLKEYELIVKKAMTAGQVFQELESLGISNITIDRVDHTEIQRYRNEVKIAAIRSAKEKASSLTSAIDQNIGNAIFIQEINYDYNALAGRMQGVSNMSIRGKSTMESSVMPDIEFEKIKLEYSILARFEIK